MGLAPSKPRQGADSGQSSALENQVDQGINRERPGDNQRQYRDLAERGGEDRHGKGLS